jgi:hypothetical protein
MFFQLIKVSPYQRGKTLPTTPSVPKCKHLLAFADRVCPFVLFKKFMKILFILL